MRPSSEFLVEVGNDGFGAHGVELRALLAEARARQIAPMLCDVAGDDSTPDSVRIRALRLILDDLGG